jgi:hypothetical protein
MLNRFNTQHIGIRQSILDGLVVESLVDGSTVPVLVTREVTREVPALVSS